MTSADALVPGGWNGGAERRQLTVLFCDIVDYTPLASAMDPEDLYELKEAYQQYCQRCVEDAGGAVAQYLGDGVLAYFGYPEALEDAPQRALHAALRLRAAGDHLPRPAGRALAVRTGVATGLVIIGGGTGRGPAQEPAVTGETPNLAARLQASAAPNAIVVGETTKRLAEGVFDFQALGPLNLKGIPGPTPAWEVMGVRPVLRRFEGRRRAGVCPLVSRATELNQLLEAWKETRLGRGRVVGLVGDPGLGKSRLLEEARLWICQDARIGWLEGGGASIHNQTPFHVVSQFAGPALGRSASSHEETLSHLRDWIWDRASRTPTVLAIEDLHWADPSTLDLLDLLIGGDDERPLLIVYTSRSNFTARWPADCRHQVISLEALDHDSSGALARSALADRVDDLRAAAIVRQVVAQANGVPLYIEELARLMAGEPGGAVRSDIPATLADLLAARLEALGPVKRHAQVAAILGHEFPGSLLASMLASEGADPAAAIEALLRASVIVPRESDGADLYGFRHALIADAAYDALLRRQRRTLHERAAMIVSCDFPSLAEAHPQSLARHWAESGQAEKAMKAWERAGMAANQRRASREAEHAFRQALASLDRLTASPERDLSELRIRIALNRLLQITQGYSSREAAKSSERVTELALRVGDTEALSREESARWRSVFTAGYYVEAKRIVTRVMALTAAHGDALWRRTFELRAGIQHGYYTGDLARAEGDFLAWRAIEDGSHRGAGDDVLSLGVAAVIAEMTGRHGEAQARIAGAFDVAERRGHPYDLAMALHNQASLYYHAEDPQRQAIAAGRLAEVAGDSGFEYASVLALGWLAVARANAGLARDALDHSRAALDGFDKLAARVSLGFWMALHARCHRLNGDDEEALRLFAEALVFNPQEKVFRPEGYLGRADLLAALGRVEEAEQDLKRAVRVASAMGAKCFHLRALTRLARLQMARGHEASLRRTMRALRPLSGFDYGAFDRSNLEALARDTGVSLQVAVPS